MILILDDDKDMTQIMGEYLTMSEDPSLSFFIKVTNPQSAIHIIKNNSFDLIITDIMMPQINGLELIKKITTYYPVTKVLCISGYSDIMMTELKAMNVAFLEKPFDQDQFINIVKKTLNS